MTESELLLTNNIHLHRLENMFLTNKVLYTEMMEVFPLMVSSNDVNSWDYTLINKSYSEFVKKEKDEIINLGSDSIKVLIHEKNLEYIKMVLNLFDYQKYQNGTLQYYQYIKPTGNNKHQWILTYKKFLTKKSYFSLHHKLSDLGKASEVLYEYLGEIALSTTSYLKYYSLTKMERRVLKQISNGNSNKDIAEYQNISINTVRTHRNRIWKKLDIKHFKDCMKYKLMYNDEAND